MGIVQGTFSQQTYGSTELRPTVVLELCRVHSLTIGLGKCEFGVPETDSWVIASPVPASALSSSIPPPSEIFLRPQINPDFNNFLV